MAQVKISKLQSDAIQKISENTEKVRSALPIMDYIQAPDSRHLTLWLADEQLLEKMKRKLGAEFQYLVADEFLQDGILKLLIHNCEKLKKETLTLASKNNLEFSTEEMTFLEGKRPVEESSETSK